MRLLLKILFALGGVVIAFGMWLGHGSLERMTADATSGDDAAVWVYTPHVAPGDTIVLGVEVFGGEDIGIREVVVSDGAQQHRTHGEGQDWGDTITTRGAPSDASDSIDVRVTVPRDARPGSTLHLVVDVSYVVASQWSSSSFSNSAKGDRVTVDVPVRTPGGALLRRLLSAGWALGLLGGLCVALYLALPRMERWADRNQDVFGDGEMAGLFFLAFTIFNAMFLGRAVFAYPLVAATGFTGTAFIVACCAVWTALPIAAMIYGHRHGKARAALSPLELRAVEGRPRVDPGDPYRAEPDAASAALALTRREQTPTTLAVLADALRAAGLPVTVKGKRVLVDGGDDKGPSSILQVKDPAKVTVDTLVFKNRDMRAALDVLHAALPVLGPVELRLPVGNFLVDHRRTRDQLRAEFDATFQAWLESLKARLRPLDAASLLGDKPDTLR